MVPTTLDAQKLEKAAEILKTIAHPLRLGVVQLLAEHQELTVSELCEQLEGEQSLISHHLNIMKTNGVLQTRRDGKHIHYSIKIPDITRILNCVNDCACKL